MEMDDFLKSTAGCGVFQVILAIISLALGIFYAWGSIFMSFGNYNPGWICSDLAFIPNITGYSNNTGMLIANTTTPVYNGLLSTDIQDYDVNSTLFLQDISTPMSHGPAHEHIQGHYSWGDNCSSLALCGKTEFHPGTWTIVTEYGLICDHTWISSLIISVQQGGTLTGSILAGYLADWKGRKLFMHCVVAFGSLVICLIAFATSWQLFCAGRFFIGLVVGGLGVVSYPYHREFADSRWRARWVAVPEWNVGVALFAMTAWLSKDWVHLHFITAALGFLLCLILFWMPESLRWLAVKGKVKRAEEVIRKMCRVNGRPEPNTDFLRQLADAERARNKQKSNYTYLHLFHRSLWKITLAVMLIFFMLSISFYAINFGIKALSGNLYLNMFGFAVAPIPAMFILPVIANKVGRRAAMMLFIGTACIMSVALVMVFFLAPEEIRGTATTVLAILTNMFIEASWAAGMLLLLEVYPTVVRSLGQGGYSMSSNIGSIVAPFLIPENFEALYVPFGTIGAMLLVCCGLIYSLPETRGKSLQETLDRKPVTVVADQPSLSPADHVLKNSSDQSMNVADQDLNNQNC